MPIERALVQARNTTGSETSTTSVIQRRHGRALLRHNRPPLRYCKRGMRLAVNAKAGAVFRLSEVVTVQSMVASHNFVRSQVCCGGARQRTATSVNLRLVFAIKRCLSRTSCVRVRAAGKGITTPIASLCFGGPRGCFLQLGGPHREEKRRGGWWRVVQSGVGPWRGRTHREGERDEEEASKVRRGFSEENIHCDWAGMSVAIEPTSSGGSK